MGNILTKLTFEEWITFNFDHPVTDPEWYSEAGTDDWQGPAAVTVAYLTRAFENAQQVFQPYSDEQLAQGFWWIAGSSGYMREIFESTVAWTARDEALEAIYQLFAQCLAPRCDPAHLSHLDRNAISSFPLNTLCYMWWDILPIHGHPTAPHRVPKEKIDEVCLGVMAQILRLPSEACQESALHGLGHWCLYYPEEVKGIINHFLKKTHHITPDLLQYAHQAREATVQ